MSDVHLIWRHISGLLLVLYVPIALFMGLQHHHNNVLTHDSDRGAHSASPASEVLAWELNENSSLTDTPYCPACHFQVRTALTASSQWLLNAECRQDTVSYYSSACTACLIFPFSERAPPHNTV